MPSASGRLVSRVVTGVVLVLIGLLWLLERLEIVDFSIATLMAVATIVIGVALLIVSRGGPHVGLVVFGAIVAVLATLATVAPLEGFRGGIGERNVQVSTPSDLQPDYTLAMGDLFIDLTELSDIEGIVDLSAGVGMGQLTIRLPEGVAVSITASAGAGELQLLDRRADGIGVDQTFESADFEGAADALRIEASVFMGRIEVRDG